MPIAARAITRATVAVIVMMTASSCASTPLIGVAADRADSPTASASPSESGVQGADGDSTIVAPSDVSPSSIAPTLSPSGAPLEDRAFTAATSCTQLLGTAFEQQLLAEGKTPAVFTPSFQDRVFTQSDADPFSCGYVVQGADRAAIEFSAQPLSGAGYVKLIRSLTDQKLASKTDGDRLVFTQLGSEGLSNTPADAAVVHLVYRRGWITVWSELGGVGRLSDIQGYANTVANQLFASE